MSPIHLSPGVYTREIDLSLYPAQASTSVLGMVGTAVKGALNKAVLITSPSQFIETFGNPTPESYLGYGALQFLEKGNRLYVVRVGATTGADAIAKAVRDVVTGTSASVNSVATQPFTVTSDNNVIRLIVDGGATQVISLTEGVGLSAVDIANDINAQLQNAVAEVTGSNQVKIVSNAKGLSSSIEILNADETLFNFQNTTGAGIIVTNNEPYSITTGAQDKLAISIDGGDIQEFTLPSGSQTASQLATVINATLVGGVAQDDGSGALQILSYTTGSQSAVEFHPISDNAYIILGVTIGGLTGTSSIPTGTATTDVAFTVSAESEGTWGNALAVEVVNRADGSFDLNVWYNGIRVERYTRLVRGASNVASDTYIEKVINPQNEVGGSEYITVSDDTAVSGDPVSMAPTSPLSALVGGANGINGVTDAHYIGVANQLGTGLPTGLQVFADAEKISINLLAVPGVSSSPTLSAMFTLCENRADSMCVIDPPFGLKPQEVTDWHNGLGFGNTSALNTSYGALYWSWLEVYDSANAIKLFIPPSGSILAVYAETDAVADPWFAPAGLNRGRLITALNVEYSPNLGERDLLYGDGNAINPIVNFVQDGITIWGQRTLQRKPSALDRVNVRRLLLYLRAVASRFSKYFVFEPNDPVTWERVRTTFEPLLSDVKSRRGISDYKVVCDETTNTPARVNRNELWANIYITPVKSAEVIVLSFIILAQGASVEETVV
jgi:phage tail sheath protein FI